MTRLILLAAAIAACGVAHAQPLIPPTAEGRPDFQGVWNSLWLTPVERPEGVPGDIPQEDVARVREIFLAPEAARAKNQLGTEGEIAIAASILQVEGVFRGSQVIDPPDGRIPRTAAGLARKAEPSQPDGPESYGRGVRCLAGVNTGPMMTSNFDALHRIVQTADDIVVYSEALGDTRFIPLIPALPANWPRAVTGSSVARWEQDTLVVETSRFAGAKLAAFGPTAVPLGDAAVLVERLRLNGPNELVIHYTVTDPENYSRPWTGEMAWIRSAERLYETVCHEANYSLANMLRGARALDARPPAKVR